MPKRANAILGPGARKAWATGEAAAGARATGAASIGALAVGAAAIGGFAIGRLSVGRLAVGRAKVGRLEVEEVEIGRLTVRERDPRRAVALPPGVRQRLAAASSWPRSAAPRCSPARVARGRPLPAARRVPGLPGPARRPLARARPRCPTRRPGTRTSRRRPSPPTRPRRSPTSTPTAATTSTPTSARRANTASPTRSSAPASARCRSTTPPTAARATGGRSRSRAGRRSRAATAATATATCSSSTAATASSTSSTAPSPRAAHWNADSGARWDLRSVAGRPDSWTSADAAGLPIFPGLVRRDEAAGRRGRPRDPGHLREHPRRLGPPRLALRRRHRRPERAGDGDAAAAEGGLRPRRLQRPGARRSPKPSSATG